MWAVKQFLVTILDIVFLAKNRNKKTQETTQIFSLCKMAPHFTLSWGGEIAI